MVKSQLQFLGLTTHIPSVPEIYQDFAGQVRPFNPDLTAMLPLKLLHIPTLTDIRNFREKSVRFLKDAIRVNESFLLLTYCEALQEKGRLPSSHYYLGSLSRTSRTFYFLDSRDLLEVLRDFLGRERGGGP